MPSEIEQAQAAIKADQERRVAEVLRAVQAVCEQHRVQIVAVPQIVDGRIVAAVQIVAAQE
jgi:hypothetical protein